MSVNKIEAAKILDVIKFSRCNADYSTKERNFCVMSMRVDGSAEFKYNNQSFKADKSNLLFIPSNVRYSQSTASETLIALHFRVFSGREHKFGTIKTENPLIAAGLMQRLYDEWQAKENGYYYSCMKLFYEILRICECNPEKSRKNDDAKKKIAKSTEYLKKNFASPDISVSRLADMSEMSEVYFRRIFTQIFGVTPLKYINSMRISYAKQLLEEYNRSIEEIAEMSGFMDSKYFSKVFKSYTDMTPGQFKS